MRLLLAKLRALFRRDVISEEIREEMRFHVDMRAADFERGGAERDEARRQAVRRFGNLAVMQDRGYDIRGAGMLESIVQDVRYGARLLVKDRGFSLVATLTLALGIGVSTALFSVIDAALLRPLPYPHPEQLVDVVVAMPRPGGNGTSALAPSIEELRAWRDAGTVFSHIGMGRVRGFLPRVVESDEPERLVVAYATEDFLEAYGVAPILGRSIQIEDTRDGTPAVALAGYRYWQRNFGGDAAVIGRSIRVENAPVTIVGVLPQGFYDETAVWVASRAAELGHRGSGTPVVGRLRPGMSLEQASMILTPLSPSTSVFDGKPTQVRVQLKSLYEDATEGYRSTLAVLTWAVALILGIACVNVAGLLLGRGAVRQPEFAIRSSLGAGRPRMIRQLLTESLVLALVGAVLGVALAWLFLDALVSVVPLSLPANSPATVNSTVLTFALVLSVVSALIFGLFPAVSLSRAQVGPKLAGASRRHGSPLSRRAGGLLIGVEVALAVVLMAGAGLMVRSFARLMSVDLGFDPASVMTMEVEPIEQDAATRSQFYPAFLNSLRSQPQVAAAGAVDDLMLRGASMVSELRGSVMGNMRLATPGYFETIGVRPTLGRLPIEGQLEAVVNEAAVIRAFGGASPIGETVTYLRAHEAPLTIVGVVPDVRHDGPLGRASATAYVPATRSGAQALGIILRFNAGMSIPSEGLKQLATAVGPKVIVGRIRPATALIDGQVATPKHRTILLSLLGAFGALLTLVGIFSMTAYAVAQRRQEIGVRMTFGATSRQIVRAMVRDAVWPVLAGLVLGLAGAYFATRIIASFLFQTTPHDLVTFAAAAALMAATALIAAWIPARRAARVDPVVALRAE